MALGKRGNGSTWLSATDAKRKGRSLKSRFSDCNLSQSILMDRLTPEMSMHIVRIRWNCFYAHAGDIVVSKIDLKNGAVGIVPEELNDVVVTNHFAVYEPDLERLLPDYFQLIIQAKFFKAHLWRNKVGAEGRKEVKLDFFEALEIPLPPIAIQRAIVDRWQTAQAKIKQPINASKNLKQTLMLNSLRISA
jgi:restriction endonuclease S subunit